MTRIDHDHRLLHLAGTAVGGQRRLHGLEQAIAGRGGDELTRLASQEHRAVGRYQLDRQARGIVALGRRHIDRLGQDRAGDIEHDARLARCEDAEAKALDQAARLGGLLLRNLKIDLGQFDDDAVGVGQREDVDAHGLGQIGDEPGALLVAADTRRASNGLRFRHALRRRLRRLRLGGPGPVRRFTLNRR